MNVKVKTALPLLKKYVSNSSAHEKDINSILVNKIDEVMECIRLC